MNGINTFMDIKHLHFEPGTYVITCIPTNEKFVGYSKSVRRQIRTMRSCLKHGHSCNRHLQETWNRHNPDSFMVEVISHENKVSAELASKQYSLNIYTRLIDPPPRARLTRTSTSTHRTRAVSQQITDAIKSGMSDKEVHEIWGISIGNIQVRKTRMKGFTL